MSHPGCMRFAGAWRSEFDEFAVNGWLLAGGQGEPVGVQDWGLTLSSIPTPDGEGWGLSVGRCGGCSFLHAHLPCTLANAAQDAARGRHGSSQRILRMQEARVWCSRGGAAANGGGVASTLCGRGAAADAQLRLCARKPRLHARCCSALGASLLGGCPLRASSGVA